MSLQQLVAEVTAHYTDRGFSQRDLEQLQSKITPSVDGNDLNFTGTFTLRKPISVLLGKFRRCLRPTPTSSEYAQAQAIFGFAFGYRLKSRDAPGEERRLPGVNNRALAQIAAQLKTSMSRPLYVQFEISDALDDYTDIRADFSAPAQDMGTDAAIRHFVQYMTSQGADFKRVIVVAHQHHIERCILLLQGNFSIDGIPASQSYAGYDPKEAQPRVRSSEEFIVSDFVSMAARVLET